MKRYIALLLAISCLFCLVGCGIFGGKDYEAEAKTFEFEGLKITLTDAFEVDEKDESSVWYESSSETSVSIDKYPLSDTDKEIGLNASVLAEETRKNLPYKKVGELKTDNGLIYIECEVESLGYEFSYFLTFYESDNALWVAYFMCDLEDYDLYREHFIKWAQSVVLP